LLQQALLSVQFARDEILVWVGGILLQWDAPYAIASLIFLFGNLLGFGCRAAVLASYLGMYLDGETVIQITIMA